MDGDAVGCSSVLDGDAVTRVAEGNVVGKVEGEIEGPWVVGSKVGVFVGGSEVN